MILLGHRGASEARPENTLAAFAHALDVEHADGFECDVRLSADGVAFVVHDPIVDGLTVAQTSAADLRRVQRAGAPLPTLAELAAFLADRSPIIVNVELKPVPKHLPLVDACRAAFAAIAARHELIVSSFDPRVMPLVDHKRAFIFEDPKAQSVLPMMPPGTDLHPAAALITAEALAAWSAPNRVFRAWTVDDADEARRLIALGVTTLITNRPGALRSSLEGSSR